MIVLASCEEKRERLYRHPNNNSMTQKKKKKKNVVPIIVFTYHFVFIKKNHVVIDYRKK